MKDWIEFQILNHTKRSYIFYSSRKIIHKNSSRHASSFKYEKGKIHIYIGREGRGETGLFLFVYFLAYFLFCTYRNWYCDWLVLCFLIAYSTGQGIYSVAIVNNQPEGLSHLSKDFKGSVTVRAKRLSPLRCSAESSIGS